jgi:nicotinamide-nucleotide amidase
VTSAAADPPLAAADAAVARGIVRTLTGRQQTVAAAESLTGGLVTAALTSVAGASAVVRGGIVAYATELKAELLGVPADLLARHGAVHPDVAGAMAEGVRLRLAASYGLATTGVAGPDLAEGKAVGTVYIAVAGPSGTEVDHLSLSGDRQGIRAGTVQCVLRLLARALREEDP